MSDAPNGNGAAHVTPEQQGELRVAMAELKALESSILLARSMFAREAGLTFDGDRDEYVVLGYDRLVTARQYREEYQRGGIAGRAIDAFPHATWRGAVEIIEDEDPDKITTFEQKWIDFDTRLKVQSKLARVDKLAGLSTFATLLIGVAGSGDLETELPRGRDQSQIIYLTPFAGGGGPGGDQVSRMIAAGADATVWEYETDTRSPRFGLAKTYRLRRIDVTSPQLERPVHWSRIIHVAEGLLDDDVFGQPRLERVWNLLADLRKVTGGGAEAFWLRANQGLHLDVDKDMALSKDEYADVLAKLKEQSELYKHQLTRWLKTRGVKVETLGSDVANFASPADAILTQIAGALAIPKRILTGSEMGELASSQDRDNWKDQVNGRQTGYAAPCIVRPLVDRLIAYGYLPTPMKGADAYEVRWPHIQTMTEQEKLEGAKTWASLNSQMGEPVVTEAEIREKWMDKAPLTDEQREKIAERQAEKVKQAQATMGQPPVEDDGEELRTAAAAWQRTPDGLRKSFTFADRRHMSVFLQKLKASENAENHHSDVETDDLTATVTYCTHAEDDAITGKDEDATERADRIFLSMPGTEGVRMAEDAELLRVLEAALVAGNEEVVLKIVGLRDA